MTARELSILITLYYKHNPSGGNCHVVLDDLNIENVFIESCLNYCIKNTDNLGERIMMEMLKMRKTARRKSIMLSKPMSTD